MAQGLAGLEGRQEDGFLSSEEARRREGERGRRVETRRGHASRRFYRRRVGRCVAGEADHREVGRCGGIVSKKSFLQREEDLLDKSRARAHLSFPSLPPVSFRLISLNFSSFCTFAFYTVYTIPTATFCSSKQLKLFLRGSLLRIQRTESVSALDLLSLPLAHSLLFSPRSTLIRSGYRNQISISSPSQSLHPSRLVLRNTSDDSSSTEEIRTQTTRELLEGMEEGTDGFRSRKRSRK